MATVLSDFLVVLNSREKLVELQRSDSTLAKLYSIVQSKTGDLSGRTLFCLDAHCFVWREIFCCESGVIKPYRRFMALNVFKLLCLNHCVVSYCIGS
jgi:hypothetical protein